MGAAAAANASSGLSWALGATDGDRLDRGSGPGRRGADRRRGGRAGRRGHRERVRIETGYARDAAGAADIGRAVLAADEVGVNVEDVLYDDEGEPLRPIDE